MAKIELEFIFLEHSISFLGSLWNHITDIQFHTNAEEKWNSSAQSII